MTTLYRPVSITSLEQLEALPEGGFIYVLRPNGRVSDYNRTPVGWFGTFPPEKGDTVHALVPVEVHHDTLCKTYGEVQACGPVLVPLGDIDWIPEARFPEEETP